MPCCAPNCTRRSRRPAFRSEVADLLRASVGGYRTGSTRCAIDAARATAAWGRHAGAQLGACGGCFALSVLPLSDQIHIRTTCDALLRPELYAPIKATGLQI